MNRLFEISLGSSLLIAALLLTTPFLSKRYTAKWRYWVWLILAVRLLLPFNLSLPSAPVTLSASPQDITVQLPAMEQPQTIVTLPATPSAPVAIDTTTTQIPESAPQSHRIPFSLPNIPTLLFSLWLLGAASFLLYHLIGYALFLKSVRRYGKTADIETLAQFTQLKADFLIQKNINLILHPKLATPMMAGFFRPALLLPSGVHPDDLPVILTHELIHYKRRDLWYKALLLLTQSAHWFNPLVHLMARAACRDIETSCDEQILRGSDLDIRRRYGETLLRTIHRGAASHTSLCTNFYGGKNSMKQRFINLFDQNKKKKGILMLALIIISTLLAATVISCNDSGAELNFAKTAAEIYVKFDCVANNLDNNKMSLFFLSGTAEHSKPDMYLIERNISYTVADNVITFDDGNTAVIHGNITLLGNKQKASLPLEGISLDTKQVNINSFSGALHRSIVLKDGNRCYQYTYLLSDDKNDIMISFYTPTEDSSSEEGFEHILSKLVCAFTSNYEKDKIHDINRRYLTPDGYIDIPTPSNWEFLRVIDQDVDIKTFYENNRRYSLTERNVMTTRYKNDYAYDEYAINGQVMAKIAYHSANELSSIYNLNGSLLKETKFSIGKTSKKEQADLQKQYKNKNVVYKELSGTQTISKISNGTQIIYQYTYTVPYGSDALLIQFSTLSNEKAKNQKLFNQILSKIRCVQLG